MLRQRAAAGLDVACRNELIESPEQAAIVNAGVHPEALVLGGNKGVDDVLGHLVIGHQDAATLAELCDQMTVAAEDAKRNLQRDVANRLGSGKRGSNVVISANNAGDAGDRRGNTEP